MKQKKKINTNVFFGFLAFMAIVWFLLSFLFEGAGKIVLLSLSFLFGAMIPFFDFTENKAPYGRYSPLIFALGALIAFIFVDFYQGLLLLLIYAVGVTVKEFTEKIRIHAEDVAEDIGARRYHKNNMGERVAVDAKDIRIKDIVELFSGEIIPVDGVVLSGNATVTTVRIDNVNNSVQIGPGETVTAGTTILSGNIMLRAESTFDTCTVSGMVFHKQHACSAVTVHEKGILRWITVATAAVALAGIIGFSVAAAVQKNPQLLACGAVWTCFVCCTDSFRGLLHNSYINAAMRCSNNGIVVKNKKLVEKSMFIKNLLFRKQGVLTTRNPVVAKVVPIEGVSEAELLNYAAYAQYRASHPISAELYANYSKKVKPEEIARFLETEDNGAMVQLKNGIEIMTGSARVLADYGIISGIISEESVLCVAVNNVFIGHIVFEYEIKEDIRQYVDSLKYAGAKNLSIITRDSERAAKAIALKSGVKRYFSELDSAGIENVVNKFGKNTVYVGYGKGDAYTFHKECVKLMYGGFLNDTPSTDGLLLSDGLGCILKFFNIIKDTRRLVAENLLLSLAVLLALIYMTCTGSSAIVAGGVLVVLCSVLCSLNCYRMYKKI